MKIIKLALVLTSALVVSSLASAGSVDSDTLESQIVTLTCKSPATTELKEKCNELAVRNIFAERDNAISKQIIEIEKNKEKNTDITYQANCETADGANFLCTVDARSGDSEGMCESSYDLSVQVQADASLKISDKKNEKKICID